MASRVAASAGVADALTRPPGPAERPVDAQERGVAPERRLDQRRGPLDGLDEPRSMPGSRRRPARWPGPGGRRRQPAEPGVGIGPGADRARHGDGQRPAQRDRLVAGSPQGGRVGAGRRPARPVERDLATGRRVPDQPERIAAEAAALGHDDAQHGVRRDRGVDRRAARSQDRQAGRGRQVVRRDDRAVAAAGHRDRHPRPAVGHAGARSLRPSGSGMDDLVLLRCAAARAGRGR